MVLLFVLSVILLVAGYFTYGAIVERIFKIDTNRPTPAVEHEDGVDYVKMPTWKVFLIQLLDIAGIGPIFGPIMGALYGPIAMLWIAIGSIFAGGVHDFLSGMISLRFEGENLPTIFGRTIGNNMRRFMVFFSLLLLILVGTVFVTSPAKMLNQVFSVKTEIFVIIIFFYYFLATILPIDKIIGRLYPFFGLLLLFMTFAIFFGVLFSNENFLFDTSFHNKHPQGLPMWPLLFVTLSCGAISGFHSTQSPLMSRCLSNEKWGRLVFYGAMICEGIIALIWCSVGLILYDPISLQKAIDTGTAALVVNETAIRTLGQFGGVLAILGVIVLPITSGDTAFRSARLVISEALNLSQKKLPYRLLIAIPLFIIAFVILKIDFSTLWRYFGWSNQTLAALVLWSAAIWLFKNEKNYWIATIPALFLTAVSITFICYAKYGFSLPYNESVLIGIFITFIVFVFFIYKVKRSRF